jgi:hypothetical protein
MKQPSIAHRWRYASLAVIPVVGLVLVALVAWGDAGMRASTALAQTGVSAAAADEGLHAYALQPLPQAAQAESGASYLGENPAQGLHILFAPEGVAVRAQAGGDLPWELGLQVVGYGMGSGGEVGAQPLSAAPLVNANRIDYPRAQLVEWFINVPEGLKQGFTLLTPPPDASDDGPVQVRLAVAGPLRPVLREAGQVVDFVTEAGAAILRYDGLVVFDATQRTLPAHFVALPGGIAIQVDVRGAVYPITIDPLLSSYLTKRSAADGSVDDFLGYDINVAQRVAVVGVYGDDTDQGVDAGTAYLYERSSSGPNAWQQVGQISADDGAAGDQFGKDVYIAIGITVVVGAPGNDDLGTDAGAAYLFSRNFGGVDTWGQLTKLQADDGAAGDGFGLAVATQRHTTIIGAPGDDDLGDGAGAVYLFDLLNVDQPTVWTQTKKLTAPDGAAGDRFGAAVVVSEDIVAVGAPGDDAACPQNPACDSGAVYIFERNQGGPNAWGLVVKRTAADASAGALLGSSINFSTDRVIAGAPGDSEKGKNAGAAYIFDRYLYGIDTWAQRPKIVAPDGAAGDQLGRAVGIGGNIAIVGAPFDDDNGENSGSAYLAYFRLIESQSDAERVVKVIAPEGKANDHFGFSVDQRSGEIVISAPMDDEVATNAGAVYFYATPFKMGVLQLTNNVEPNAAGTNWNYLVQGPLSHTDSAVGDAQSAPVVLFPGLYTITQQAGANTNLSQFISAWACTIDGNPGPSGSGTSFQLTVGPDQSIRCGFTHQRPGSVTIEKQSKPTGGTGFGFVDDLVAPNAFTLDAGSSKTFVDVTPGLYTVREETLAGWRLTSISCIDPDNGSQTSDTTATIDLDAGESVVCTYINKAQEGISVLLSPDVTSVGTGQSVLYTYRIINDSPIALAGVVATDDRLGPVALPKNTLAPNETISATLRYTVTAADPAGPLRNTVVVTATNADDEQVTDSTSVVIDRIGDADIALSIVADLESPGVEDVVTFAYEVTNVGATRLANVRVVDSRLGAVSLVDTTLEPGESSQGTLSYAVAAEDLPGPLVETANAVGVSPTEIEVSRTVTLTLPLRVAPSAPPRLYLPNLQ